VPHDWNPTKAAANLEKHGVAFSVVERFEWPIALVRADTRQHYGEVRLNALAPIGSRVYHLTYTVERRVVWVISLRKANDKEIDRYEASL
jgi:uncharacterized protein